MLRLRKGGAQTGPVVGPQKTAGDLRVRLRGGLAGEGGMTTIVWTKLLSAWGTGANCGRQEFLNQPKATNPGSVEVGAEAGCG